MKQNYTIQRALSALVLLMVSSLSWAYDFKAENTDGVTIYYNSINGGTEAEVTYSSISAWTTSYFDEVINIPETVEYDGKMLSVTSIGYHAFYLCSNLTSVTIPNSVTRIVSEAFRDCSGLTSVNIPNSVTSIGEFAFSGCSSLTSVYIPNSVTYIGIYAFADCSSLTSFTIPNSVTSIGIGIFYGCSGLTSVTVDKDNPTYDSRDNCNAIIKTASNTLVAGCKSTVIPNSVTSIGNDAFQNCSGLTSMTIPEGVTYIGYNAFSDCSSLTSITIPEDVTSIDDYAFANCTNLTSVYSLVENPFSIANSVFSGIAADATLYVPQGTKNRYEAAGWTTYFRYVIEFNATGISEVNPGQSAESYAVYGLNGAKVNVKGGDLKSLPRGIYVVNGKKTIVK